jgi:serine/threonine-protein kinase
MSVNPTEALINGLRDAGLWTAGQAAMAFGSVTGTMDADQLAEMFKACGSLTSYQIRKIRHGRIVDLTLGSFVIQEKIGEGGMGKVYKATSSKLGKVVALKVVRTNLMGNKTVIRRYKREAAAAAALDHPNIVSLLDADECDGRYYLAMEFVDGSDLSRLVKENGPLAPQEAAEYIRQSALGLQHAHDRGLIHRDIKPSNLLVSGDRALPGTDGVANVKILDMGLVRSILDDEDVSRTELTRDGTVVGTPDYMAPEQAKNSSKVDARADLYSLGATLFYLLRGQAPFPDGSPIDKLLRHQLDPPPDLRKLRPDVPRGLVAIVDRLMKKNPDDRYQTATELAIALQPFTPAADAGLIFAPEADAGVSLDLPSPPSVPVGPATSLGSTGSVVVDAEVVEAEVVVAPPKPRPKPRPAAPKRIVRPSAPSTDANSGSMPGPDNATRMPGTTPPRGTGRSAERPAPPRVPYRKPADDSNRKIIGFAVAGAAAILLLVAAIAMLSNGGGTKPSAVAKPSMTVPTPNGTGPDVPNDPPPPAPATLAKTETIVAENAVAVLSISPQAYWKRTIYDTTPQPNQAGWLKQLTAKNGFDPKRFDRITVSLLPGNTAIAVGEGNGLTDDWQKRFRQQFEVVEPERAWKNLAFYHAKGGPVRPLGCLIGNDTMVVGPTDQPLFGVNPMRKFASRFAHNKSAEGLDPVFVANLPPATAENPPFVTFVATRNWRLPDPERRKLLFDYGVSSLVATARIVGEEFEITLTLAGDSEQRLRNEFVSLGLATHLTEKLPALQPFVEPITLATPIAESRNGKSLLTLTARWPIADALSWLESLLGTPTG